MKKKPVLRPFAVMQLVVGLLALQSYIAPRCYLLALAQQQCTSCPNTTTNNPNIVWNQNSGVTVNINPYWPQAQRDCIVRAFDAWSNNNGNAGVRFVQYTYNSTPPTAGNTVQVNWQTPNPDPDTGYQPRGEVFRFPNSDNSALYRAVINIDPRVNDCTALIDVLLHEIGHTFGLGDCPTCCPGTTVMDGPSGTGDYFNEQTNARSTPGSCDVATVNTNSRYNPNTLNPPSPNPPAAGGGQSSSYTNGYWGGSSCYQWFNVTTYYACYSSGCTYMGTTYQPASGVVCF